MLMYLTEYLDYVLTIIAVIIIWLVYEIVCRYTYGTSCWEQISVRYEVSKRINADLQDEPMLNDWHCAVEVVYKNEQHKEYECDLVFSRKKGFFKSESYEFAVRVDYQYKLLFGDYKDFIKSKLVYSIDIS